MMGCGASQGSSSGLTGPKNAGATGKTLLFANDLMPLSAFFKKEGAAIKKLVLVRHANAAPRDAAATAAEFGLDPATLPQHANAWTASDLSRPLTEKGQQQAAAAAADWAAAYSPLAVVTSEAVRARATLEVLAPEAVSQASVKVLPALHPSASNAPLCEKMFDTLGCASRPAVSMPSPVRPHPFSAVR